MDYTVTNEHRNTFQQDGVVKLPGVIDAKLLEQLNRCFDRSVNNPGPIVFGSSEGDEFSFVDYDNPESRAIYAKSRERFPIRSHRGDAMGIRLRRLSL